MTRALFHEPSKPRGRPEVSSGTMATHVRSAFWHNDAPCDTMAHVTQRDDDASRLRAVAETCKALGMTVGALKVGDIEVRLVEPWGAIKPPEPKKPRAEDDPTISDELRKLRQASRKQFGRVLPDEKLKAMKHALLGHA